MTEVTLIAFSVFAVAFAAAIGLPPFAIGIWALSRIHRHDWSQWMLLDLNDGSAAQLRKCLDCGQREIDQNFQG